MIEAGQEIGETKNTWWHLERVNWSLINTERGEDLFEFYRSNLEFFFAKANYHEYSKFFSKSFFPLNESVLKYIFREADGNPREVIKYLIKIFNDIVISNEKLEVILEKYQ